MSDPHSPVQGDKARALGRVLVRISQAFQVNPSFTFYDDREGRNAMASPESRPDVANTWGSVLFGRHMYQYLESQYSDNGFAVVSVLAHEFGHIAQFRSGIMDRLLWNQRTVKRVELHADYLAGYFIGLRKRQNPSISVYGAGRTFWELGDFLYNDRNHHGTPDQRKQASEAGFRMAMEHSYSFEEVFNLGAESVSSVS